MQQRQIFPEWGTEIDTDIEEFLAGDREYWQSLLIDRNLLVIRGLGTGLTDSEFFQFGSRFGRVWTLAEYSRPYVARGRDPTLIDQESETPVSYFQSHNNAFGRAYMAYHADMPHVRELSYPGRALYMTQVTNDGSGTTTWLNLELGWAQTSESEKSRYANIDVIHHDMYQPNTRMESFPWLKTNPHTGRASPRVNCWYTGGQGLAWIHHLERGGRALDFAESGRIIAGLYELLESKINTMYQHHWQEGDIIVYDNWFNVHRRDPVNDSAARQGSRLLKRLTFNL